MQLLYDPPTGRELAQFLDPDGAAWSFRLEKAGDETTAHPTGQFGRVAFWFLRFILALCVAGFGIGIAGWWQPNAAVGVLLVVMFVAALVMSLVSYSATVRYLKWRDQFSLVHGPFARWNAAAGTLELPRLGVILGRDQLVGVVYLTGGEWCGACVRAGAWCPLAVGLPDGALGPWSGWVQVNELSVIAQAADGRLARYPVLTVENPWRFREFAGRFAADFGLPLQVIRLTRAKEQGLRRAAWKNAGEFADGDRPRKVAAGRVAVGAGNFPGVGAVSLCRPDPAEALLEATGRGPAASHN